MSNRNDLSKLLLQRAREMRSEPNDAESSVWKGLRAKRLRGFKFRRQHPIGVYIVDLYCHAAMLVIEFDGSTHLGKETYDATRQSWLESQGLLVIRFGNRELDDGIDGFLEIVWRHCVARTGSTRGTAPLPNPLPGVPGRGNS
jgi:very-short-patch-repair endonuclease